MIGRQGGQGRSTGKAAGGMTLVFPLSTPTPPVIRRSHLPLTPTLGSATGAFTAIVAPAPPSSGTLHDRISKARGDCALFFFPPLCVYGIACSVALRKKVSGDVNALGAAGDARWRPPFWRPPTITTTTTTTSLLGPRAASTRNC